MARFGGKTYGLGAQAKGPAFYGLTREQLVEAWNRYHQGFSTHTVANMFTRPGKPRLSLKKLVVEWGVLGLQVWVFGRRGKIRRGTQRLLKGLQDKFDMPLTPTVYAALKFADAQGADLRAIVEAEFGAPPKRPKYWYDRDQEVAESLRKLREARERHEIPEAKAG